MAADLLYNSVPELCLIISGAARYQLKPALNNIPSLCVYYDLYGSTRLLSQGASQKWCISQPNLVRQQQLRGDV